MRLLEFSLDYSYRKVRTLAKYSNTVEYQIRTTLDSSGLAKLKAELTSLANLAKSNNAQGIMGFDTATTNRILADINKVRTALTQAFNPKLGMMSNKALFSSIGSDLNSIYSSFSKLGPQGVAAFGQVYGQIGKIDLGMKQISSTSDKIMNTFGNTFRWGMIASIFSGIMNTFHQAAQYVKDLDNSLTQISMVSGIAKENMNDFAVRANEAAKQLGGTTVQMTEATKVFIQQGFDLPTSTQLGSYAVHLANVSEQDSATASDEITAYMNAFKIPLEDLGNAISKWAIVANNTAVDVEELSIASQKAASVAATVGVDMDQFAGHIAAIESVTREAPENIGNGLKTIYSRIADISLGKDLEDGVNLGSFSKALQKVGVDVLDSTGQLRDAGDILEDTMAVWQDLNQTQRAAVAKTVAGRFQLARFEALMNRADIYEKAVDVSREEEGTTTYDRMQETYKNSMEGRLNTLSATIEGIFVHAFNTDDFYGLIDAATGLAETFDNLIQSIGGGSNALMGFAALMTKVFSDQIGRGISNMIANRATTTQAQENRQGAMMFAQAQLAGKGLNVANQDVMALANNRAQIAQYAPHMNNEQIEVANKLWQEQVTLFEQLVGAEAEYEQVTQAVKSVLVQLQFSAEEADQKMMGLLKAIEAGGEQSQITKATLESLNIEGFISEIYNLEMGLTEFATKMQEAAMSGEGWHDLQDKAVSLGVALSELGDKAGFTGDKAKLLEEVLRGFEIVISGDITDIEGLKIKLEQAGLSMDQFRQGLLRIKDASIISTEGLEREQAAVEATRAAYKQKLAEGTGMGQNLQTQNIVTGLTNIASAGMTAVFAMQSLVNIFRIMNNDDLTFAEKAEQLAMNIAMVAAMGIPAITQTKAAMTELKTSILGWVVAQEEAAAAEAERAAIITAEKTRIDALGYSQEQLNMKMMEGSLISKGFSKEEAKNATAKAFNKTVTDAETTSEKNNMRARLANVVATKLETSALGGLIKRISGVIAANTALTGSTLTLTAAMAAIAIPLALIAGVALAIKHHSDELERQKELTKQQLEVSNSLVNSWKENKDELNELYDHFVGTGEASDELKEKLLEQAEAFDISNAKVKIATERYYDLKQEIDEAAAAQLEYNNVLLEAQNQQLDVDAADKVLPITGHVIEDYDNAQLEILLDAQNQVKKNEQAIKDYQTKINNRLLEPGVNAETDEYIHNWQKEIQRLKDENIEIGIILNDEDVKQFLENIEQIEDNKIELTVSGENEEFNSLEINDTEDIREAILSGAFGSEILTEYKTLGAEAGDQFVLELATTISEADLPNVHIGIDDLEFSDNFNSQMWAFADTWGENDKQRELAADTFKNMFANNKEFQALSAEEQNEIIMSIDVTKSAEAINKDLQFIFDGLKNNKELSELVIQIRPELSEEEVANAINTAHLSDSQWEDRLGIEDNEGQFDLMKQDFINDNKQVKADQEMYEQRVESAENYLKTLKKEQAQIDDKNSPAYKNYNKKIEQQEKALRKAEAELEDFNNRTADTVGLTAEATEGLATIVEKMEDWNEALASGDYKERAAALQEIGQALGQLTHLDVSTFDDTFIMEHMDDIQLAAQGDIDAINRIRMAAAEKIIVDLELPTDIESEFTGILGTLQTWANDTNIAIGATFNDQAVLDEFANLVTQAGLTAEQIEAITNSIESLGLKAVVNREAIQATISEQGLGGIVTIARNFPSYITWEKTGAADSNWANRTAGGAGGGKGGGGGGGGGKGKSYEPKKKDYEKKEKDRYEKVNTAIDKIDSSIQNLTMDQDRLIGTRWADNLEKETKLLKEQIPWYQEKLKIQKAEAAELKKQLSTDFGAKFGSNGQLQNYAKIFDNLEKARKAAYDKYNAATTEAGQEAAEKEIQAIEKRFETFNKIYARYDTLWSKEMPETEKALKDIQDRLEDIVEEVRKARREAAQTLDEIRETEKEVEKTFHNLTGEHPAFNLEIDFDRLDDLVNGEAFQEEIAGWIDDYKARLAQTTDKDMKNWYKEQITLLEKAQENGTSVLDLNIQRAQQLTNAYNQWMSKGKSDLFGENEQAMFDAIKEAQDDLKDFMSNVDDTIQNIKDDIEKMSDMLDNEIEKRQNDLDAIGDKIEHIQNLSEMLYGDQATAQQINLYNLQAQNEENRLKELEKEKELQHQIVLAKEKLAALDPENATWQEEYLDALEKEREIDGDILDTREKIVEAYKDAKETANDLAVDNWLNNFQGVIDGVNVPLEYMADQWERIQENEDLYLDDLNKAYEIQKLQNKYQEMLNDATDPAIQQQITDQMNEQLQYLREKTNLSKYDVDYANAQLEILQKTIALEDARDAKNQMKLRRDSQGNYQYVYAANKNQTLSAENDLLDATMDAYNMSKEQQADVQDSYIKKIQDMGDALRKAANDQKLTKEQIAVITQDIIDQGYEYLNAMGEQLDTSQKNMIQSFIDAAFQMQIENASAVQDIASDLQDGIIDTLDMVDDRFDTSVKYWIGDDGLGKFRNEAEETRDAVISNVQDFEAAVSDANAALARPLNEMESEVDDINSSIETMTDSMAEFFNLLEQKSGVITAASDNIAYLQQQLTDANSKTSEYVQMMKDLEQENKKQQATITQLQSDLQDAKSGKSGSGSAAGGSGKGGQGVGGTNYSLGELSEGIAGNIWTFGSWGNDPKRLANMKAKFGADTGQQVHDAVQALFNGNPAYGYSYNPKKWASEGYSYYRKFGIDKFDTGGYTGIWGNDGKLALLHEKELVLNAEDTRNILAAVDAVRIITEQLKGAAFVNNIADTIGRASQNNIQGSSVEQRVEITATFPNASSAREIEEALLSLSDTSYQYAYNKNDTPW